MSQHSEARPEISRAGIVYGDIIYWVTIAGTVLTLIGSVITFTVSGQYMDAGQLLENIWAGKTVDEIWQASEVEFEFRQLGI